MPLQHRTVLEVAAGFVLEHPRHHVRPTGHANSRGIVMRLEDHPIRTQPIEMRRLHARRAVAAHGAHGLIVGQQENNVRPFVLGGHTPVQQKQETE